MSKLRIHKKLNQRLSLSQQQRKIGHKWRRKNHPNKIWASHRDLMQMICLEVGIDYTKLIQVYHG